MAALHTEPGNDWSSEERIRMAEGRVLPTSVPVRKLVIGTPVISSENGRAVMRCMVSVDSVEKTIEVSVDSKYAEFLCCERADAYLIGLLNWAMRERCDIVCEAPVTEELLFNINRELLPVLVKYSDALYSPRIEAVTTAEPLPCAGAVGTGCSLGVDSLHAIKTLSSDEYPGMRLTHLLLNNVGAYTAGSHTNRAQFSFQTENARRFAEEYGYELIVLDSNFAEVFPQNHLRTHLYSSLFGIYLLRKLWKTYFYASSGCDLAEYFGLLHNELFDTARYELLAFPSLSIPQMSIRSVDAHLGRFEKLRNLLDYQPTRRYLNVCTNAGKNCGRCPKCRRTMWSLEALGVLEEFGEVFDVHSYFREGKARFYELYWRHTHGVHLLEEAFTALRPKMAPSLRMKLYFWKEALMGRRPS